MIVNHRYVYPTHVRGSALAHAHAQWSTAEELWRWLILYPSCSWNDPATILISLVKDTQIIRRRASPGFYFILHKSLINSFLHCGQGFRLSEWQQWRHCACGIQALVLTRLNLKVNAIWSGKYPNYVLNSVKYNRRASLQEKHDQNDMPGFCLRSRTRFKFLGSGGQTRLVQRSAEFLSVFV